MSSMYLYWAFQSSEEFSALETSFMAISFFAGSSSPVARAAVGAAAAFAASSSGIAARDAPNRASTVRREALRAPAASGDGCTTGTPSGFGGWGVVLIGRFPIRSLACWVPVEQQVLVAAPVRTIGLRAAAVRPR